MFLYGSNKPPSFFPLSLLKFTSIDKIVIFVELGNLPLLGNLLLLLGNIMCWAIFIGEGDSMQASAHKASTKEESFYEGKLRLFFCMCMGSIAADFPVRPKVKVCDTTSMYST